MTTPSIRCPRVSGDVEDFGAEHPEKYRESALLSLRQYWEGPDAFPAEQGSACVGAAEDGLSFYACLIDSDIFSRATADNQRMWTLGDVAEFFVKPGAERSDYWEIHVTPNGYLMDLHIPDRERFTAGEVSWEEVLAPSSGTLRRVELFEGQVGGGGPHPLEGVRPRFSPGPGDGVVLRGLPLQLQQRPGRPGALLQRRTSLRWASTGGRTIPGWFSEFVARQSEREPAEALDNRTALRRVAGGGHGVLLSNRILKHHPGVEVGYHVFKHGVYLPLLHSFKPSPGTLLPVAPAARFPNRADTGTLVPVKTQAPLSLPGTLSTAGHLLQSIMISPRFRLEAPLLLAGPRQRPGRPCRLQVCPNSRNDGVAGSYDSPNPRGCFFQI